MQTRSSSRLVSNPSSNPTPSTNPNPKGRNRRHSKQRIEEFNLDELSPPIVMMADQRTMAQLLQAPTEGYEDAIVRFDKSFSEAWDRFKDLLRACPHHCFSKLQQLDTFYNALNSKDQDSLNSAAGGNFLDKMLHEWLAIIVSKSKVYYSRNKPVVAKVSTNTSNSGISPDVAKLKDMVKALLLDKKSQNQSPSLVKAVEESCVTCGGAHSHRNCPATDGNIYCDNIQEFVSQASAVNYNQGNTSYRPPMMNNQNRFIQNQNWGNNFNQGPVYQPPVFQPPAYQAPTYQAPAPQTQGVSKEDFSAYVKANDAVMRNMQTQDEAFARQLKAKINANINWNDVVDQVKRKEKQDNTVTRYQALKRKHVTEAQARKNMMVYLKNMAGFKMDFFRQMTLKYLQEYTQIEVQYFRDTMIQQFCSVWKSIAKRTRHKREYENRVNKRMMEKVDMVKALVASLVVTVLALGWHLEEIHVTWGSFGEETDKITDLHQIHEEVLLTDRGDSVAGIKRCCRDPSSDGVWNLEMASGHNDPDDDEVLKELIEYENVGVLRREKAINSFDGDDLAFEYKIRFRKIFDNYTFQMPRTIPRFKCWGHISWSKIPPILLLSQRDWTNGFKNAYEKNKFMYKNRLNTGLEYHVDESMKEWLIHGYMSIHEITKFLIKNEEEIFTDVGNAVRIILDAVFSTWMAFGGNTRDLGSFGEETDKITDLHQIHEKVLLTERGDGVAGIKRRRRDPSSDDVWNLEMASGRSRLKENLESSTLRWHQDHKATPSSRYLYIYRTDFRVFSV
uniref:Reverse transcriptase domain-containing protein n=1 Tax=Tanacetum cinerariifolium TaxID=118510 RepID=A0A6L2JWH0_TANCI|nr:reverse transcriptase domain-containing protein [Tanacetum cinerariifolium]